MRIITSVDVPRRLMCFLCERDNGALRYVDTKRDFFPVGKTKLDGRKRVCERCVREMALLFEDLFVSRENFDAIENEGILLAEKLHEVEARVTAFQALEAALEHVKAPEAPKPAPKPKKAAEPVKEDEDGSADA